MERRQSVLSNSNYEAVEVGPEADNLTGDRPGSPTPSQMSSDRLSIMRRVTVDDPVSYRPLTSDQRVPTEGRIVRRPMGEASPSPRGSGSSPSSPLLDRSSPIMNRYRYYSKLTNNFKDTDRLRMPPHVVPSDLFLFIPLSPPEPGKPRPKQSSIITIFSLWNTLMGSSLLTMSWAIQQAGFVLGIVLMPLVGSMCLYTCILILRLGKHYRFVENGIDWSDIVGRNLGRWGEGLNTFFSVFTLLGACMVYWVLMSNFLYRAMDTFLLKSDNTNWHPVWSAQTAAVVLLAVLFPLICLKEVTFFTKFNALGIVSVAYIALFTAVNLGQQGATVHEPDGRLVDLYGSNFTALTGVLMLSFFGHNLVLAIVRNNRDQDKNERDVTIAFGATCATYLVMGLGFYCAYHGDHHSIPDNILDTFPSNNMWALVARVFLLFQMITVFPLLAYVVRIQTFQVLFNSDFPGWVPVLSLNVVVAGLCLAAAVYFSSIGTILRFTGALSGAFVMFLLPCAVWMRVQHRRGELTVLGAVFNCTLVALGFANFAAQFR
eukprot:comp15731_c0_seq1/m.12924 comp15731_c0_seq1/g.12924  ORF comp15731_c0_seq1/g.12924 comp15731_c0_seq1/m.12924 type:complete len:545 (-) comp15731_c0_seq1:2-1636(-)